MVVVTRSRSMASRISRDPVESMRTALPPVRNEGFRETSMAMLWVKGVAMRVISRGERCQAFARYSTLQ
jgi:hypothetical protein